MQRTLAVVLGSSALVASLVVASFPADAGLNLQREARTELGRRLFLDPLASNGGKFSCASCHEPEHGFSDPRVRSVDENGPTARHSQPLLDLRGEGFHWDGEFDEVDQLLVARLGTSTEVLAQTRRLHESHFAMAKDAGLQPNEADFRRRIQSLTPPYYGPVRRSGPITTPVAVANRVDQDGRYDAAFQRAFGSPDVTTQRMVGAMGDYLATLTSTDSPFDDYRAGSPDALSPSAKRGLKLFRGKAGCESCHPTRGPSGRFLSDGRFHNTGIAMSAAPRNLAAVPSIKFFAKSLGRQSMTFVDDHVGRFKTPSLRDVAVRPPYMHDGRFATLHDVVDYYAGGGTWTPHLDPAVKPFKLADTERDDLVSFLESLTGAVRPGIGPVPRYRAGVTRFTLTGLKGEPVRRMNIRVVPTGDRIAGTDSMPEPFDVRTGLGGSLDFKFPLSTHVRLEADEHEIEMSRLIPDSYVGATMIATPRDMISVLVRRVPVDFAFPSVLSFTPQVWAGTSDRDLSMALVRPISDGLGLYAVSLPRAQRELTPQYAHGVKTMLLRREKTRNSPTVEIDFGGGMSEMIDLRPFPVFTEAPRERDERRKRRDGDGKRGKVPREAGPSRPNPGTDTGASGGGNR